MDIREETRIALKDAYWAEVRKLFDVYLHAIIIAEDKDTANDAAADRYKKGLLHAKAALERCLELTDETFRF